MLGGTVHLKAAHGWLVMCALAVASTAAALAQQQTAAPAAPLVTRNHAQIHLAGAELILHVAQEKATAMNLAVNIWVVDSGGHPIALARMDRARPGSAYTALTKAFTSATMRVPTGPFPIGTTEPDLLLNLSIPSAAAAGGGKITTLKGGLPIVVDGDVIGAVGVGGATGEQDAEIAKAGLDAFMSAIGASELKN